jgi:Cys-tRNA(Pro) deacylase
MHPTAQRVADAAREIGLDISIKEFTETTRTAEDAAGAIGCTVAQIVKSLLFMVDGQPTLALVSGPNRLDEAKLATLCGVGKKKVKRADANTVRVTTGYAIGGVPPFGHKTKLPVYIDRDFWQFEIIWAAAGTPNAVFPINPAAMVRVTGGVIADLKVENAAR